MVGLPKASSSGVEFLSTEFLLPTREEVPPELYSDATILYTIEDELNT